MEYYFTSCNLSGMNLNTGSPNIRGISVFIDDSTITSSTIYYVSSLIIKDSTVTIGYIIDYGLVFDIEDSYIIISTIHMTTMAAPEESLFKNCTIDATTGTIMSNQDFNTTINVDNCSYDGNLYFIRMKAVDSDLKFDQVFGSWIVADKCDIYFKSNATAKELTVNECNVTGYGLYGLHNSDDIINVNSSTIDLQDTFYNEFGSASIIKNSTIKAREVSINRADVDNTKIESERFLIRNTNSSIVSMIKNSVINSTEVNSSVGGGAVTFDNSIINCETLESTNAILNLNRTKIVSSKFTGFKQGDFDKSYVLTYYGNSNNYNSRQAVVILNYVQGEFDITDIDNNPIDFQDLYDNPDDLSTVLLRDRVSVTFRVENGTWEDGSDADKSLELYAFDTLSFDQIPTNMIAKDGYENGSWDSELMYDELNDDYVFTYSYKKKGIVESVKGVIEELTENPQTGVFSYSFIILALLSGAIIIYIRIRNNTLFKKY